jgi:diadenosine tetraphosphatase ApaH/serine/threonine PP2A family protein phosphatase
MGNHDFAVLYEPNKFNLGAETACFWTRRQLEDEPDAALRAKRWEFLGRMKTRHVETGSALQGEMVFVHGSPRRPVNEYVFPDDVYNSPGKMEALFERFSHLCFVGHTHVPGVFVKTRDFYTPEELKGAYEIEPKEKALINVGSVGQPRDRDPRASYALVDPDAVHFIRVPYDVESIVSLVTQVPDLDNYLGSRLRDGR